MSSAGQDATPRQAFARLAAPLDRRSAPRRASLFIAAGLVRGRRTAQAWINTAKLSDHFRPHEMAMAVAGNKADAITARLFTAAIWPLFPGAVGAEAPPEHQLDLP